MQEKKSIHFEYIADHLLVYEHKRSKIYHMQISQIGIYLRGYKWPTTFDKLHWNYFRISTLIFEFETHTHPTVLWVVLERFPFENRLVVGLPGNCTEVSNTINQYYIQLFSGVSHQSLIGRVLDILSQYCPNDCSGFNKGLSQGCHIPTHAKLNILRSSPALIKRLGIQIKKNKKEALLLSSIFQSVNEIQNS